MIPSYMRRRINSCLYEFFSILFLCLLCRILISHISVVSKIEHTTIVSTYPSKNSCPGKLTREAHEAGKYSWVASSSSEGSKMRQETPKASVRMDEIREEQNPVHWPSGKKWRNLAAVSFMTLLTLANSSPSLFLMTHNTDRLNLVHLHHQCLPVRRNPVRYFHLQELSCRIIDNLISY